MNDPAFEFRPVHFQVDGAYVDSFQDSLNFVSVNVRKSYPDRPAFTKALTFTHAEIKAGSTVKDIAFPRLGAQGQDWIEYEYQLRWSLRGGDTLSVPSADKWVKAKDPAVALTPPFEKRVIEIDADRSLFAAKGIATAVVEIAPRSAARAPAAESDPARGRRRVDDAASRCTRSQYADGGPRHVAWEGRQGRASSEVLESDYLYLTPPDMTALGERRPAAMTAVPVSRVRRSHGRAPRARVRALMRPRRWRSRC